MKKRLFQRYVLGQFLHVFGICLFATTALFLLFESFEKMRTFLKEDATILQVLTYLLYKIPLIIHLMMPIAVLIATLTAIGRLSQLSEITALRACGASVRSLARPLMLAGLLISAGMFLAGETIVPWATARVEEIYHLDIKKKAERGKFSRADFWYRDKEKFYNIGLYDSREETLKGISMLTLDNNFKLDSEIDAQEARWYGPRIGWTMEGAVEIAPQPEGDSAYTVFGKLPLVIQETPQDFYHMKRVSDTMSFRELRRFIENQQQDGLPVNKYLVDLHAKIAFPLVNFIVVLIALPFALIPARSGSMVGSFIAGLSIGFGYFVVHAVSTSFGAAELIPTIPAAWTATVLMGCLGGYLLAGADYS